MIDKDLLEQLQKTAHLAAWRAGQIVREQYTQPRNVHVKGPRDLVTDTDFAAQAAALEVVRQRHPAKTIVGIFPTASSGQLIPSTARPITLPACR
jgi:fructose-1,6-bisphosphatase/inositol monophosphatase family enzyme